ncbi:hypothetical protein [Hymenobacter cavernae]|nr:hypothetical protein [Hymenobacter cavernae]
MANINRIELTTTSVYVFFSDGTFWPGPYATVPCTFLYHATEAQRANWQLVDQDTAVEWPDLAQKLTMAQMGR